MVIFEAAFLFNEITESFKHESIFNAFKSKKPKFIFTDQYPVIAKVLATLMLEMMQRLSTWHIMQSDYEEAWDKMKKLGIK